MQKTAYEMRISDWSSDVGSSDLAAICAPIAPYRTTRRRVREAIEAEGGFIDVYVSTPLEVCEQRDRKGLYAKARAGVVKGVTGIDAPYAEPENPDIVIDTEALPPDMAAHRNLVQRERLVLIR